MTETGDIKIAPGVGKQSLDPKNINFLEVPGPGKEAVDWLEMLQKQVDNTSGITDPLMGTITGKTAFEIAQAKEAALKRLKTPLENITDALDNEAYITISLAQMLYSVPEIYTVTDPALIEAYLQEVNGDPDLFGRDDEGNFQAKVPPEFPLNLEEDKDGNLAETEETKFFRVKPKFLEWEGIINVEAQSVLTPSKQVDKALDLEMYNMLIPLLMNPPELYQKVAKELVKLYDKDPKDILPASWLAPPEEIQAQARQAEPLIVPAGEGGPPQEAPQQGAQNADTLVAGGAQPPTNPQSLVGKVSNAITKPFR